MFISSQIQYSFSAQVPLWLTTLNTSKYDVRKKTRHYLQLRLSLPQYVRDSCYNTCNSSVVLALFPNMFRYVDIPTAFLFVQGNFWNFDGFKGASKKQSQLQACTRKYRKATGRLKHLSETTVLFPMFWPSPKSPLLTHELEHAPSMFMSTAPLRIRGNQQDCTGTRQNWCVDCTACLFWNGLCQTKEPLVFWRGTTLVPNWQEFAYIAVAIYFDFFTWWRSARPAFWVAVFWFLLAMKKQCPDREPIPWNSKQRIMCVGCKENWPFEPSQTPFGSNSHWSFGCKMACLFFGGHCTKALQNEFIYPIDEWIMAWFLTIS